MILPEEIENQQFEVSFRGYNTREVDEFLSRVHADLEEMIKEQEHSKRKIAAAELIAKDAKDHEEEFLASMENDRNMANSVLENAKTEGEKIIREAKNAASGIMAEVKRRAGDISSESRRTSADIVDCANRDAEETRAAAEKDAADLLEKASAEADAIRAEADKYANNIRAAAESKAADIIAEANESAEKKLFSARTEADNISAAANTESAAIIDNAKKAADQIVDDAKNTSAVFEEYITEIRTYAEKLCFELDAELRNSASRITLLGKRISATEIPDRPEESLITEEIAEEAPAVSEEIVEEAPDPDFYPVEEETPAYYEEPAPAHATAPKEPSDEIILPESKDSAEGYFSAEYKLAMAELFGEDMSDSKIPTSYIDEDDDTYDYLESTVSDSDDGEDTEDADFDGTVTSEYSGLSTAGKEIPFSDMIDSDVIDQIYKAPSQDEINDIFNN